MTRSRANALLPSAVTMLGEVGDLVIADPLTEDLFVLPRQAGRILCAAGEREMFILRPLRNGQAARPRDASLHVFSLWERFHNRKADAYYNCVVPSLREARFAGEVVLIRYLTEKHMDADSRRSGPIWWEHYFDSEGASDEPAYAPLWLLGHGQYYIGPGKWIVDSDGIKYFDDPEFDGVEYVERPEGPFLLPR